MKKVKTYKGYIIAYEKAPAADPHAYTHYVFTKDEYDYGEGCRYPEWECDSVEECMEWIGSA